MCLRPVSVSCAIAVLLRALGGLWPAADALARRRHVGGHGLGVRHRPEVAAGREAVNGWRAPVGGWWRVCLRLVMGELIQLVLAHVEHDRARVARGALEHF